MPLTHLLLSTSRGQLANQSSPTESPGNLISAAARQVNSELHKLQTEPFTKTINVFLLPYYNKKSINKIKNGSKYSTLT